MFAQQTATAIIEAVDLFDHYASSITPDACRHNALRFTREQFRAAMLDLVASHLDDDEVSPAALSEVAGLDVIAQARRVTEFN